MFSLVRRIGCSIVLLIVGAAAYATKDLWIPKVKPHLPPAIQRML
jgi:hypothetical protein